MSLPEITPTDLAAFRDRTRSAPPAGNAPTVLPTGTVTFLLTDIEGSTRQWEDHGPEMARAVGRHYEILDAAVREHGGVRPIEQGEGDSLVAAFERATDAVAAALDAQRRLTVEPWPAGIAMVVRIALHTGEAQIRDGRYYAGPSIIRCARLRGLGHGGEVLISGTTADLLAGGLPAEAALLPLGVHRLRDLVDPQRVFQLLHPELPAEFAPLKSLDVLPNNLPVALSTFVGREPETAELARLGRAHRLLTLVGPGGSGKTRLATRSAAETLDEYPDGVWWIDLSPLTDPERVPLAMMNGLGMGDDRGLDPIERIVSCLISLRVRLVLDNCEHVGAATAASVDALLRRCPGLAVLATSREPLGVPGEVVWRVPPMALPTPDAPATEVAGAEAVQLFVQRCTEARPGFTLTADLAPTVAAICLAPGRPAVGHRACRRAGPHDEPRADPCRTHRPVSIAHRRGTHRAGPPTDSAGFRRVEPSPAGRARAHGVPSAGCLCRRVRPRRRRGGRGGRHRGGLGGARCALRSGRQVTGHLRR